MNPMVELRLSPPAKGLAVGSQILFDRLARPFGARRIQPFLHIRICECDTYRRLF